MATRLVGSVAAAALVLSGCTVSDEPPPASKPTVTAWNELETRENPKVGDPAPTGNSGESESTPSAPDPEEFDPACLPIPEPVVEWLDDHSWQYSKTRPSGAGKMVAAGGGWYIAAVPTTGDFDAKGWAWLPGDGYPIARIVPLPADWDEIDPDDEEHPAAYHKSKLLIEDGAYTAAMACIGA